MIKATVVLERSYLWTMKDRSEYCTVSESCQSRALTRLNLEVLIELSFDNSAEIAEFIRLRCL